jgi:hypothetical protein
VKPHVKYPSPGVKLFCGQGTWQSWRWKQYVAPERWYSTVRFRTCNPRKTNTNIHNKDSIKYILTVSKILTQDSNWSQFASVSTLNIHSNVRRFGAEMASQITTHTARGKQMILQLNYWTHALKVIRVTYRDACRKTMPCTRLNWSRSFARPNVAIFRYRTQIALLMYFSSRIARIKISQA